MSTRRHNSPDRNGEGDVRIAQRSPSMRFCGRPPTHRDRGGDGAPRVPHVEPVEEFTCAAAPPRQPERTRAVVSDSDPYTKTVI